MTVDKGYREVAAGGRSLRVGSAQCLALGGASRVPATTAPGAAG